MDNLIYLDDITVDKCIELIRNRYNNKKIYTQLGAVLLSVNPYQYFDGVDDIYNFENSESVHLFRTLDKALAGMKDGKNQTIIVSGESGSGKTETTKQIVQYLNKLQIKTPDNEILQQIEAAGLVLELFGNAATEKNHNSSRFGKYIEIFYAKNGFQCVGMKISAYLLEKYRVLEKNTQGRFHIFNQHKTNPPSKLLARAGLSTNQIHFMLKAVELVEEIRDAQFGKIENPMYKNILTGRSMNVQDETIEKVYNEPEFDEVRDMFAMKLYETLFFWLVDEMNLKNKINESVIQPPVSIGILDIFGFENLAKNGLEQLCINYANEIIQGLLNKILIEDKIKLYHEEQIPINSGAIKLNTDQIDLIERVFIGLDEECMLPKGSNRGFIDKLNMTLSNSNFYSTKKLTQHTSFFIEHYAGKIEYSVMNFCQSNLDKQNLDIEKCIACYFAEMLQQTTTENNHRQKKKRMVSKLKINSISNQFRNNLADFIQSTQSNSLHFIKCIKPNPHEKAMEFIDQLVQEQLVYNGVIQLIVILKQGYSCHFLWKAFQRQYGDFIMETDSHENYAIGKTRIFLTQDYFNVLKQRFLEKQVQSIQTLQAHLRRAKMIRNFIQMKAGLHQIESRIWSNLMQRDYHLNRSALRIQHFFNLIISKNQRKKAAAAWNLLRFFKSVCRGNMLEMFLIEKKRKWTQATVRIQIWWRKCMRKKNDIKRQNTYLESMLFQKDCKILTLERRILELEQRIGRSLILDKNIIHERDHVIVSLKKDIERYQHNISERLDEKLKLMDQIEHLRNQNRVLIHQLSAVKTRPYSGWFSRFF